MNPTVRPWWETGLCSENSPPTGCSFSFFKEVECKTEFVDGIPVKRCIQLRKRLLNCPGREPLLEEQNDVEHQTSARYPSSSSPPPPPHHGAATSRDVGQALEEVIRLAEDLQEGFLPLDESRSSIRLDTPPLGNQYRPAAAAQLHHNHLSSSSSSSPGLLTRFFKRRGAAQQEQEQQQQQQQEQQRCGGSTSESTDPWKEYSKDFHEV